MNSRLVPVNASTSASGAASSGANHRQKLDQIRSTLRPFEQKWYEEEEEEEEEFSGEGEDGEEEEEDEEGTNELLDGKKADMVRALVEAGYDQESAFYALKLVNFRSVMAAIQVLASIKKNLVQQHANHNNHFNNGAASSGIALINSFQPSKQFSNGAASSSAQWTPDRLSQAKSLPMEQKSPFPLAKPPPQIRPVHRAPTMVSPPPPRIGPSPGQALRQSQSFGPADLLQQQQAKSSLGTVIRIERNQSERVERNKEKGGGEQEWDDPRMAAKSPALAFKLPMDQKANPPPPSSPSPLMMSSPQPVQRIFIDPQGEMPDSDGMVQPPPDYSVFMGQLNQKMNATRLGPAPAPSNSIGMPPQSGQPNRSVSPLPESVAKRLKAGNYERVVKPCRAPMFRFFMEQHIEKLTQQYHERNKRARQLSHEMEAAGLADNVKENMLRLLRQKESKYLRMRRQKMNKGMFELIRHIGIGAFGKVTLVRKWDTDQVYAMKTLVKADVIQKQQAAHVKAERDILAEANSPWIVKLFFSFQDPQNLYFIMEYVPGGDMMQLLINMGIFPESLAKFYIAELTLAVEYVHSLGFIHRDIKPDNILIDKGGHIKLTDFGLCTGLRWTHDKRNYVVYEENGTAQGLAHLREDSFSLPAGIDQRVKVLDMRHHRKRDRAHSVVGTGNYMAPEVIQRTGYNQATDWWSVGVILYEMVYGRPPFMSQRDDPAETQYMIVHWRRFLDLNNPMGARLSRPCVDCIAKLCCDQQNRMGQRAGAKDIKGHAWFKGVNFANLRQSTPEYIPRVRHAEDTSNFDTFEVRSDEQTKAPEGGRMGGRVEEKPGMAPNFIDFTFRHFFSEGMGPPGGIRSQQPRLPRPSLAPLMETNEAQQAVKNNNLMAAVPIQSNNNKIGMLAPPMAQQPNNPGDRSPLSARTILQIGGPIGAGKKAEPPFKFRPFQTRLDEQMEEPEESQC